MTVSFGSIIKAYDNGASGQNAQSYARTNGLSTPTGAPLTEQEAVGEVFKQRSDNVNRTLNYRNFAYAKLGNSREDLKNGFFIVDDGRNSSPITLSNGLMLLPSAQGWKDFWNSYGSYIQQNPIIQRELKNKLEVLQETAAIEMQDEKVRFVYDA